MTLPRGSQAEMERFLEAHPDIQLIDLLMPDMNGILRGKQLSRSALKKAYTQGVRLPLSNYILDCRGLNVAALDHGSRDGDPDGLCFAVPGSLRAAPWTQEPCAQVLISMCTPDGAAHFADPRYVLKQVLDRFAELGLKPVVALEFEFYLLDLQAAASGNIRPAAGGKSGLRNSLTNVYGMDELFDHEDLFADIRRACQAQQIDAETFVVEFAPGQYEINLMHSDDPLAACDQAVLLKRIIRQVALKHGALATFMAKPFQEHSGSGLHIHCSLLDDRGANAFVGAHDPILERPVGPLLRQAAGGMLAAMAQSIAIFCPNANSYRRMVPNAYAPVTGHWGNDNRTLPIRMPPGDDHALRLEHRVAGADANPYLVMAAVLAGIHHGISHDVQPSAPCMGNAFEEPGVPLPVYWPQALDAFEQRDILAGYFDDEWCRCFAANRRQELQAHHATIAQLDYDWYLMGI